MELTPEQLAWYERDAELEPIYEFSSTRTLREKISGLFHYPSLFVYRRHLNAGIRLGLLQPPDSSDPVLFVEKYARKKVHFSTPMNRFLDLKLRMDLKMGKIPTKV